MHSDIEKVAKKLRDDWLTPEGVRATHPWSEISEASRQHYRRYAKDAILATLDAIREPTEAMMDAADKKLVLIGVWGDLKPDHDAVWEAMIDAKKAEILQNSSDKP